MPSVRNNACEKINHLSYTYTHTNTNVLYAYIYTHTHRYICNICLDQRLRKKQVRLLHTTGPLVAHNSSTCCTQQLNLLHTTAQLVAHIHAHTNTHTHTHAHTHTICLEQCLRKNRSAFAEGVLCAHE